MPMPGSPSSVSAVSRPARAEASSWRIASSSACRPMTAPVARRKWSSIGENASRLGARAAVSPSLARVVASRSSTVLLARGVEGSRVRQRSDAGSEKPPGPEGSSGFSPRNVRAPTLAVKPEGRSCHSSFALRFAPRAWKGSRVKCAACGTDNEAGRKFCVECGAPLAAVCPACGSANAPQSKFCGECGASLAAPAPVEPQADGVAPRTPSAGSCRSCSSTWCRSRRSRSSATPRTCAA